MIHIYSKIIPPKGFWAMSIAPFLIQREGTLPLNDQDFNHENIHCSQQSETTIVALFIALVGALCIHSWWWMILPFTLYYVFYGLFSVGYFIKDWIKIGFKKAISTQGYYYDNPYEKEAYDNEDNLKYLIYRKPFYSWRYLKE